MQWITIDKSFQYLRLQSHYGCFFHNWPGMGKVSVLPCVHISRWIIDCINAVQQNYTKAKYHHNLEKTPLYCMMVEEGDLYTWGGFPTEIILGLEGKWKWQNDKNISSKDFLSWSSSSMLFNKILLLRNRSRKG